MSFTHCSLWFEIQQYSAKQRYGCTCDVSDFDISKLLSDEDSMTRTMTLTTIGYMAPGDVSSLQFFFFFLFLVKIQFYVYTHKAFIKNDINKLFYYTIK